MCRSIAGRLSRHLSPELRKNIRLKRAFTLRRSHLWASPFREPAKYFENNVAQGIALLDVLVSAGVRRMVFSSTCATYGEPKQIPIAETCPQWPVNPYGWSKLMVERMLDSYDKSYGLKFVTLRYFNAAGATERRGEHHDPESHLVPNVSYSAALGEAAGAGVFGDKYPTPDGTAIRDYVHVVISQRATFAPLITSKNRQIRFLQPRHGPRLLRAGSNRVRPKSYEQPNSIRMAPPRPGDPPELVADAAERGS